MVTAEGYVLFAFGLLFGGWLGYVTSWRLARKLEHHRVSLADWDQPLDLKAERRELERVS
jgi:hypothetical protein